MPTIKSCITTQRSIFYCIFFSNKAPGIPVCWMYDSFDQAWARDCDDLFSKDGVYACVSVAFSLNDTENLPFLLGFASIPTRLALTALTYEC